MLRAADMILGEVGHDRCEEGNAVNTVELDALRGDLDDGVAHAPFRHFGKDAEKLVAFGCRVSRRRQLVSDADADRTDGGGGDPVSA